MTKRIGGWKRLWLVIAVIYLFAVVAVAWTTHPQPEQMRHTFSLYSSIPQPQRNLILNTQVNPSNESDFIADAELIKDTTSSYGVIRAQMANGHTLIFRAGQNQTAIDAAAKAYWASVEHATTRTQELFALQAAAWWAVPLFLLYVLGLSVRWIYRGFRSHGTADGF